MRALVATVCLVTLGTILVSHQATSEFIVKKSNKSKTSGQLKEKIAELLEALAYRLTMQVEKLAQAQYLLIDRMHELAAGDSSGVFSGASHKNLQEHVLSLENHIEQAECALKELATLNHILKEK